MAKLIGYIFQIESNPELDDDKIKENFEKIKGVTGIDYCPSYWGSPCVWTITFEPPERWKGMADTQRRLDRAVVVRKGKRAESKVFSDHVSSQYQKLHNEMMARGGPFSNVKFVPAEGK